MNWPAYGLAIDSRTDVCSVGVAHYVEQVQYVEPQEDHISPASYLHNRSTSDMSIFVCRCNLTEGTFFRSVADPLWYS
jgi:hypothetical protein